MSEENVETMFRVWEAWNRRDFESGISFAAEDFELHHIGGMSNLVGEEFNGREGLLRAWRDFADTVGGQVTVEKTYDLGERVALVGTVEGAGVASGVPGSMRFGQVWHFREGMVSRVDSYYHSEEALEAAGLSE
jgi:ketosteroid isomerase-like protein